jgi:uncharacterized membrane protein
MKVMMVMIHLDQAILRYLYHLHHYLPSPLSLLLINNVMIALQGKVIYISRSDFE